MAGPKGATVSPEENYIKFKQLVDGSYIPHGGEWKMLFSYIDSLQFRIQTLESQVNATSN